MTHHHHHHDHELEDSLSEKERAQLRLKFMIDHNQSHTDEIKELTHLFEEETIKSFIVEAVKDYERGNEKLKQALKEL